jgi:hypothetical protein
MDYSLLLAIEDTPIKMSVSRTTESDVEDKTIIQSRLTGTKCKTYKAFGKQFTDKH